MTQKERARKHYVANRDVCIERARRRRKYLKAKQSSEKLILERIKGSAKARGIFFDLVEEDIIIPKYCPYTGLELRFNEGRPGRDSYSMDRLDNTKGYTKDNIEVISYQANAMKQDASKEILVRFAKEVLRRYEVS